MTRASTKSLLFAVSCGLASGSALSVAKPAAPANTGLVRVVMTVDWEGRKLDPANIAAVHSFRQDYPALPIVQYLNAAYYFKPRTNPEAVTQAISATLLPIDQLGLHIHGWKSLFTAAGVSFRKEPNWNPGGKALTATDCAFDCGHSIPIRAYTEAELSQVIKLSVDTLSSHGFGRAQHFRTGGWMLSPELANALAANDFVTDSSAVPAEFLRARLSQYPLYDWAVATWRGITPTSQPYLMQTTQGSLLEVPDNACLADYMSGKQMLAVLKANLLEARSSGGPRTVVVGFHQETAVDWLPNIRDFLAGVESINRDEELVEFVVMPTRL